MKLDLVSDLHLEFFHHRFTDEAFRDYWTRVMDAQSADVLLMAGDLSADLGRESWHAEWLFTEAARRWQKVIAVLGNHDYWSEVRPYSDMKRAAAARHPQVTFLENEWLDLGDARLFGATWWSRIAPADELFMEGYMKDYEKTIAPEGERFGAALTTALHEKSRAALLAGLEESDRPVVVLTHHAPSFESCPRAFDRSNTGFCSADDDLMLDHSQIRLWCHGHLHNPSDYVRGDARVLCRPHGYVDWERKRGEAYSPASAEVA